MSSFFLQVSGAAAFAVNLPSQINNVYLVGIGLIGFIALAGIIIGGFQYVASAGNAERASHAKTTIIASVSGLMLALLSVFILNIFSPQFTTFSGDWFINKDNLEPGWRFVKNSNGVYTGTAGTGTTYTLQEVQALCTCGSSLFSNGDIACIKFDSCAVGAGGACTIDEDCRIDLGFTCEAGRCTSDVNHSLYGDAQRGAQCNVTPRPQDPKNVVCAQGLACIDTDPTGDNTGRCDLKPCIIPSGFSCKKEPNTCCIYNSGGPITGNGYICKDVLVAGVPVDTQCQPR